MPRYIDAEKLKLSIIGLREGAIRNKQEVQVWALNACEFMVETADTADVEEVKHGEWEMIPPPKVYEDGAYVRFRCSECGTEYGSLGRYCRNCGARMDGREQTDGRP